jgi:hypothetical protein
VLNFGVLRLGDHTVNSGVRKCLDDEPYREIVRETKEPFKRADFAEVIRLMDRHLGESNYSVRSLFRDEQRRVVNTILAASLREAEALYRQIYENRAPTMRFITDLHIPLPKAFHAAAEFVLNGYLREALTQEQIDLERVATLLETVRIEGVAIDGATMEFEFRRNLERMASRLCEQPTDLPLLQNLDTAASLLLTLPFAVDQWQVQNDYYKLLKHTFPKMRDKKGRRDELAEAWTDTFLSLGKKIAVHVG